MRIIYTTRNVEIPAGGKAMNIFVFYLYFSAVCRVSVCVNWLSYFTLSVWMYTFVSHCCGIVSSSVS